MPSDAVTLFDEAYDNRSLFSDHFLEKRLPQSDAWHENVDDAFESVQRIYRREKSGLDGAKEAQTEEDFIRPVLDALDWHYDVQYEARNQGRRNVPDYMLFTRQANYRAAKELRDDPDAYEPRVAAVADAKYWGRPLDSETGHADREKLTNANPSFQIVNYMTATHRDWGLLTNGKRWRLYYAGARSRIDTYYEANLYYILETDDREAFRWFYLFFRAAAFQPNPQTGASFLQRVHEESEAYAADLEDRLKALIFEDVFPLLAEGFADDLQTENIDRETLNRIYHGTLRLLYRLLFLLHAEARDLLPLDDPGYARYSLHRIKRDVADLVDEQQTLSGLSTNLWTDLRDLFRIVSRGEEELNVPTYNGGLFSDDHPDNAFFDDYQLADKYLTPALDTLARTANPATGGRDFVDYKALDVEQLGSIYEGLLEFGLVMDDGDLALENDKGERKATGSYYTPHYIVEYITEHTLGPVLEEREERFRAAMDEITALRKKYSTSSERDLRLKLKPREDEARDALLGLTVCDPAMGSGHFLVYAVDYLTERLIVILNEYPQNPVQRRLEEIRGGLLDDLDAQGVEIDAERLRDTNLLKRLVMKRCIYGVDLNPMAVELAKLSLWLDSFTIGAPLSFLDHHLRCGNALIGSRVQPVERELKTDLLGSAFGGLLQGTELMQQVAANTDATPREVQESAARFGEYERAMRPYKRLLDLHTGRHFGNPEGFAHLKDYGAQLRDALKRDAVEELPAAQQQSLAEAERLRRAKRFFHWELAFPEVFFDLARADWKQNPGFNAVIGNPPYVRIQTLNASVPNEVDYYATEYTCSYGSYDLYLLFVERGVQLLHGVGQFGYILPNKFFLLEFGKEMRRLLRSERTLRAVVDIDGNQIFEGQTTYTCLLFLSGEDNEHFEYVKLPRSTQPNRDVPAWLFGELPLSPARFDVSDFSEDPWVLVAGEEKVLLDKLASQSSTLDEQTGQIFQGLITSADYIYAVEDRGSNGSLRKVYSSANDEELLLEKDLLKRLVSGQDARRHVYPQTGELLIFPYELTDRGAVLISPERFETDYPQTWQYLKTYEAALRGREGGKMDHEAWYAYGRTQNLDKHERPKLGTARLVDRLSFFGDFEGEFYLDNVDVNGVLLDEETSPGYLLSVLNSTLLDWRFKQSSVSFRGDYFSANKQFITDLPIREIAFTTPEEQRERHVAGAIDAYDEAAQSVDETPMQAVLDRVNDHLTADPERADVVHDLLAHLARQMTTLHEERQLYDLDVLAYLGERIDGPLLPDLGVYQPSGGDPGLLSATAEDRENLRIGRVSVERNGSIATISATARYKPANPSAHDTDRWGYTESAPLEAFRLANLSDDEAALVEHFVPVAAEESGGFAGFRENATKTNSLLDRLKAMQLPEAGRAAGDVRRYAEAKRAAGALDAQIAFTDALIDRIVYRLYGLTDEEIAVVEGVA